MSGPAETVSREFWQIIADVKNDRSALAEILEKQSSEELRHFYTEFLWLSAQLQDEPFIEVAAAHADTDEDEADMLSEDAMEDIANWVVSQGKDFYSEVLHEPELIAKYYEDIHATDVGGVAAQVYWARFEEPLVLDTDLCDEYDGMI